MLTRMIRTEGMGLAIGDDPECPVSGCDHYNGPSFLGELTSTLLYSRVDICNAALGLTGRRFPTQDP